MADPGQIMKVVLVGTAAGAAVCFALAWYAHREFDHPIADPFAAVLVADGLWSASSLVVLLADAGIVMEAFASLRTLFSTLAAIAWVRFVVAYTGDREWLPDWTLPVLVAEGLGYWLLWTLNPGSLVVRNWSVEGFGGVQLLVDRPGPLAWVQILFIYALLAATVVLLGRYLFRSRNVYRTQTALIMSVVIVVGAGALAWPAGLTPHPGLDVTPLMFVAQALIVWLALTRFGFLKVVPTAADTHLEEMTDPVFVVDTDGRVVDYNRAAARLADGASSPRRRLEELVPGPLREAIEATAPGERGQATVETTPSGDAVIYDVERTAVTDHFGTAHGYLIVCRDVSDRVAQLRRIEAQNDRLNAFASVVSHDLRNPIQVIDGHLELARQTGDLSHLDDASAAVDRMDALIEDLLTLARQGREIDDPEPVPLDRLAGEAWATVRTEDASLEAAAERSVAADPDRLRQALENLFRNAVEHVDADTVVVGDRDDGFFVADDGSGIPLGDRERVFEHGYSTNDGGTGLGLGIVSTVVESHGWTIEAGESEAGGARFDVVTDARTAVTATRDAAGEGAAPSEGSVPSEGPARSDGADPSVD